MGAGFALQIRQAHPDVYTKYKQLCNKYKPEQLLGHAFVVDNIISVFGQLKYGRDKTIVYTNYNALEKAFKSIDEKLPEGDIVIPYGLGCGLGNGNWEIVNDIIIKSFKKHKVIISKNIKIN